MVKQGFVFIFFCITGGLSGDYTITPGVNSKQLNKKKKKKSKDGFEQISTVKMLYCFTLVVWYLQMINNIAVVNC